MTDLTSSGVAVATIASASVVAAAVIDLRTRRVPNVLTGATALAGIALGALTTGWPGLAMACIGGVVGLVLMLPGYVFGGTGGGDVKLLAAVGTLLGPGRIVEAFIGMAMAGGCLALGTAIWRGCGWDVVQRLWAIVARRPRPTPAFTRDFTFAYAPAIAAGVMLVVLR